MRREWPSLWRSLKWSLWVWLPRKELTVPRKKREKKEKLKNIYGGTLGTLIEGRTAEFQGGVKLQIQIKFITVPWIKYSVNTSQ